MSDVPPPMPPLNTLYDTLHDGICRHCRHCLQWIPADSVFLLLPHMDRVVCLRCADAIIDTPLRMGRKVRQDAIQAAGSD